MRIITNRFMSYCIVVLTASVHPIKELWPVALVEVYVIGVSTVSVPGGKWGVE